MRERQSLATSDIAWVGTSSWLPAMEGLRPWGAHVTVLPAPHTFRPVYGSPRNQLTSPFPFAQPHSDAVLECTLGRVDVGKRTGGFHGRNVAQKCPSSPTLCNKQRREFPRVLSRTLRLALLGGATSAVGVGTRECLRQRRACRARPHKTDKLSFHKQLLARRVAGRLENRARDQAVPGAIPALSNERHAP